MNVCITGGTGFIGSRLALHCASRGDIVRVLGQVNNEAEQQNKTELEANGIEVLLGSVSNKDQIEQVLQGVELVFHLAAAQHEMNIPDQVFYDVNEAGTKHMLEASAAQNVKRFVYGSTIGVYGEMKGQISEQSPCRPDNIYGKTKQAAEKLVLSYQDRLPVSVIRISETYGPGDRRLLKLFKSIQKNLFFMIGKGDNFHHLIFIDDLIKGLLTAAENDSAINEIFVLAGPRPLTTHEMVKTIADHLGAKGSRFRSPMFPFSVMATAMEKSLRPLGIQPPLHRRRLDFFRKSFYFSQEKAERCLGFKPDVDFRQGVALTSAWYSSRGYLEGTSGKHSVQTPQANETHDIDMKTLPSSQFELTSRIEPFDTFWEAPENIEKGYGSFGKFYKRNYLKYLPADKSIRILTISCGPGYFVDLMNREGYQNVMGIDSDPGRIAYAKRRKLNCQLAHAFDFLKNNDKPFDLIFAEQEINHLTKKEILQFFDLCRKNLNRDGHLVVHSLNGANPITGSEALAQNFDHQNTLTEYSLRQIFEHAGLHVIKIFPLNLYIFYENPVNYIGMAMDFTLNLLYKLSFVFYGKTNNIWSKKIGAIARKQG